MGNAMKIISCSFDQHAPAILEIFNEAILNSTALYEYQPRTINTIRDWFAGKSNKNYPVIGVESDSGELLGFASYGIFRAWPAYKYSVEHSIYVHRQYRGKSIGTTLLRELISAATRQNYHIMVGGIDVDNRASIALHEKLGFVHAGTIKQAGFKFGRWLDLAFYQLVLQTPAQPVED